MLILLMMGCVHPLVTPGICNLLLSSFTISSFVLPGLHSDLGFNKIIVSIMLIGELSVAVLARPALPKTFFTSGTEAIILSCTCNILFTSVLEISGIVTGINRIEPSSNGGINSLPKLMMSGILTSNAIMFIAIVVLRHLIHQRMSGSYIFPNPLLIGLWFSGVNFPFIKNEINTGVSVITSMASTATINVLVNANGPNNFPSCPVNKNTGKKEAIIIMVEKNTPLETCLHELSIIPILISSGIFT